MISGISGTVTVELEDVTNIYTLIGYLFFLCIYVITHYPIISSPDWFKKQEEKGKMPRGKKQVMGIILILVVFIVVVVAVAVQRVHKKTLIIAKDNPRAKLHKRVEVGLINITTLQDKIVLGRPGLEYNLNLSSDRGHVEYIHRRVFEKADVANPDKAAEEIWEMDQKQWEVFLKDQGKYKDRILDIPFAKFRVYIDGVEKPSFKNRYYFKGDDVEVGKEGTTPIVKFRLEHVYNTNDGSDEPDAVIARVVR